MDQTSRDELLRQVQAVLSRAQATLILEHNRVSQLVEKSMLKSHSGVQEARSVVVSEFDGASEHDLPGKPPEDLNEAPKAHELEPKGASSNSAWCQVVPIDGPASGDPHRTFETEKSAFGLVSADALTKNVTKKFLVEKNYYADKFFRQYHRKQVGTGWLVTLVKSGTFEAVSTTVIVLNTLCMAVAADRAGTRLGQPEDETLHDLHVFEVIFSVFYIVEVVLRVLAYRVNFIIAPDWMWNVFDFFLAVLAFYDVIKVAFSFSGGTTNVSFLRVIRVLKILKLLRIVRLMRSFRELRLMLHSIMGSMKALLWACVLILAVTFMFSMAFLQGMTEYLREEAPRMDHQELENLTDLWGSLGSAMITLYVSSMGGEDWKQISYTIRNAGDVFFYMFLAYIGFFAFVIMNTLTSLFVEAAMENANNDGVLVVQAELSRKDHYAKMLRKWYDVLDIDHSGTVTLQELQAHIEDDDMVLFASEMGIELFEVEQFFTILSGHGTRPVDLETFVIGCIKLKGSAKNMDLVGLIHEQRASLKELKDDLASCNLLLAHIVGPTIQPANVRP